MVDIFLGPQKSSLSYVLAENSGEEVADSSPEPESLSFDSWIHQYQQNVKDEKIAKSGASDEDLKKIFDFENQLLEVLYRPLSKCIQNTLQHDVKHEGRRLYSQWGLLKQKQYNHSCFDNAFFRAQYASQRFHNAARCFMQSIALRIIPQHPKVEEYLRQVQRIVSVGVGPCCDVAGMLAFLRARGMNQPLTYFLLDQCPEWREYIEECDRHWTKEFNVTLWFKIVTVGRSVESLIHLPDGDVIVFSFADTAVMNQQIWPLLRHKYRLVIVLDGIKQMLTETFKQCQFTICRLNEKMNLYYSYRHDEDDSTTTS